MIYTFDGSDIRLPSWYGKYPIKGLYSFLCQVVQDFFHQEYHLLQW